MSRLRGAARVVVVAAFTASAAIRVEAEGLLTALPDLGEHRSYRWTWTALTVNAPVRLVGHARFDVERRRADDVVVTDAEHAPKPIELLVVDGALRSAPASGAQTTGFTVRSETFRVAARAQGPPVVRETSIVGVPPPHYRMVVMLSNAMKDASDGAVRSVPGCGDSGSWNAALSQDPDGTRTLKADCSAARKLPPFGENTTEVTQKSEDTVIVRFDTVGRLHDARGTRRNELEGSRGTLVTNESWTLSAD